MKMQNKELLPCPFCGGENVRFGSVGNSFGIDNYIKCDSCYAKIQICEEYGIEKLKAKWNTRKPMERIVERLEEMRDRRTTNIRLNSQSCNLEYEVKKNEDFFVKIIDIVRNGGKE